MERRIDGEFSYHTLESGSSGSSTLSAVDEYKPKHLEQSRPGDKEDLFAMYENLSAGFEDLTFKGFCSPAPSRLAQNDDTSLDASLDFTAGLEAIRPRLSSVSEHEMAMRNGDAVRAADWEDKEDALTSKRSHFMADVLKSSIKRPSEVQHRIVISKENNITSQKDCCATCKKKFFWIFKIRCLVCGKRYCTNCVKEAMGSMTEGRKCKACLGRRFSQRYVDRAGKGCHFLMSKAARMAEIKWARKKPMKEIREETTGASKKKVQYSSETLRTSPRAKAMQRGGMQGSHSHSHSQYSSGYTPPRSPSSSTPVSPRCRGMTPPLSPGPWSRTPPLSPRWSTSSSYDYSLTVVPSVF